MKHISDTVRISYELSAWEWALISDALDKYAIEHMDQIDCSPVVDLADHIDETIGIKNFDN